MDVRDGASNTPTRTDENGTLPRNASTAETQRQRLNGLDAMQRQMAQAARRCACFPADMISDVDLRQLKAQAALAAASAQNQLGQRYDEQAGRAAGLCDGTGMVRELPPGPCMGAEPARAVVCRRAGCAAGL